MRSRLTSPDVGVRLPLQRLRSAGRQENGKTKNNVQLLFSSEAAFAGLYLSDQPKYVPHPTGLVLCAALPHVGLQRE